MSRCRTQWAGGCEYLFGLTSVSPAAKGGGRDLKRQAGQRPQEQREGQSVHASSVDPGPARGDVIDCFLVLAPSHGGGSEAYKMPLTGVEEQVGTVEWEGYLTPRQFVLPKEESVGKDLV